ncbi:MAG TPA: carboxypeptidase regulatory-like domain-containing protein [Terriglobia bacterium]|nr:carboxypeptidase regulatory-like domain-containing protein [Terriglobia bacterium]
MKNRALLSAGLMCLLFAAVALAQNITATISGTVTDPSGAVVPNATITLHSNDTNNDVRTVQTDSTGVYSAALLPIGNYTVTIKAAGFQDYVANHVVLHVGDHLALDAQLVPGAVTQEVTVNATATPVQTSTAAQSGTVTGTQIRELQLNNRNFEELVTLQPGVASSLPAVVGFGIENIDAISVNGARPSANNWTVDGADVNDTGSNFTLLNVPSVDALSEFTLARGTYDAQYGRSGGGQVNVVTKSGTSDFHGSAYEFVRNDVFNANDFFVNSAGGSTPPFKYNDFGYTIGGPIYIPGHYNTDKSRTFFFWSQEWRRTRTPGTNIFQLPDPTNLNGTFTGLSAPLNTAAAPAGCITSTPETGGTFTGQISPACFSHNASVYLQNVFSKFTPNAAGNQLIVPESALNNYRQEILRLDQKITNKVQVFGRAIQDNVPTTEPGGLFAGGGLPGISSTATNAPGRNFVAHVTMQLSPNIVNEAAFNYSWGAINSNITGLLDSGSFASALNLSGFPFTDPYGRIPTVSISGIQGVNGPVSPYHERNIDKEVYDNVSLTRGNHAIRTGASFQYLRKTENASSGEASFTFDGVAYGNPAFADFLLGDSEFFSQASRDTIPDLKLPDLAVYVEDDWKVRPNLTLNLGVRYERLSTPTDANKILDNFDPALFNPANVPQLDANGNFVAGQAINPFNYANGIIVNQSGCNPSLYFEAPVSGFGPTCSPFGNRINPNYNTFAPRIGFAWDPFHNGKTSVRGGYGLYYDRTLNGIWEQNTFVNPPYLGTDFAAPTAPVDNFDNPLQGAFIPLGPAPLHGTGTPAFKTPYNQQWSFSVQREIVPNTLLEVAYVGNTGTHLLGIFDENQATLAARTAAPLANVNSVRPFVGYGPISVVAPQFSSNYNSLQVSLNRRVSQGLTLGIAYTWSKTLTNTPTDRSSAPFDTYNFAADYGPADFSRNQIFVANYVYDLPFYRSQQGLTGRVLGGWELSGITTFESGFPTTIFQFFDPFDSAFPGGIGIDPSVVTPRPDRLSNGAGPGTVAQFINTAAFTDSIGHFGNSGRGIITGPGLNNWDLAAIKNVKLSERFRGQFRAEFFNAFNHVSFNSFNNFTDSSAFGQLNGDFEPRIIQFGLKLYF